MKLSIDYSNLEASHLSLKGNPIALYALGLQGHSFQAGGTIPLRAGISANIFTGVTVSWDDPTIIGLLTAVENPLFPSLRITNSGTLITSNSQREICLTATSLNGELCLLDYGVKLANLYFIKLESVSS